MSVAVQTSYPCPDEGAANGLTSLQDAFDQLKTVLEHPEIEALELDAALERCAAAEPQADYLHRLYRDVGRIALDHNRLDMAEAFAIRSLKSLPRYGEAFRLLGEVLRAAGHNDDAAICYRYGLPVSVREKWFGDTPCTWIQSDEVQDGSVMRTIGFHALSIPLSPPGQWRPQKIIEFDAKTLNVDQGHTVAVADGALWFDSFNTVLWDANGRIVQDACRGYAEVVHGSLDGRKPLKLEGRVALLGNRNANNYYHWMNDILPRLAVLESSGYALDSIDQFVVNSVKLPFQIESLQALGIRPDRLHIARGNSYVSADEMLVAAYGSNSLGMSQGRWNPEFLNRLFAPSIKPDPHLRLYVSRGSTGARGISNESELIPFLESMDFQVVLAEGMTIRQQAALYSAASVVLGPHGAGLSNIAFCQPGTRVIELFNAHIAPCFWTISEVMGLHHHVHFCGEFDEVARPSDSEAYHRSANSRRVSPFAVNLEELKHVLSHAGIG